MKTTIYDNLNNDSTRILENRQASNTHSAEIDKITQVMQIVMQAIMKDREAREIKRKSERI